MELSESIHLLADLLGEVIREREGAAIFNIEERIRDSAIRARRERDEAARQTLAEEVRGIDPPTAHAVASAFTLYFDLVNLAEDANRIRALRQRERQRYPEPNQESIAEALALLKARNLSGKQVQTLLDDLSIELVLTAHPTEAKRRTLLSKLDRIAKSLRALDRPDILPREVSQARFVIRTEITSIWLTERNRTVKPAVTDEVRTTLFFLGEIFWDVLPRLYDDLERALAEHYPTLKPPGCWLTIASWIGGDRDGNPNVTAEVTAETLRLHRGLAVERHRERLQELARRLSWSQRNAPVSPPLQEWLASRPRTEHATYLEKRYDAEPYRLAASLLAADLVSASEEDMKARLLETTPHTARVHLAEIKYPLDLIAANSPSPFTAQEINTIRRQLDIFGLHAARLDLREESSQLAAALGEILRALKIDLAFEDGDDARRTATLTRLLAQPSPVSARNPGATRETAETWALFQLIARARSVYGKDLLGPFIISMTRGPADVLTVLLLAHWAGCADGLQIVPLFETVDDLEAAPRILAELFSIEVYRRHLQTCRSEQMVMIGYSDSNKDGGFVSANWALYQAQEMIAQTCHDHQVKLTFFHGRGGTAARGGGPANRAIRAQPPGTIGGRFRVTEQGETIANRYTDPDIAYRHLEQMASAVLLASAPDSAQIPTTPTAWRANLAAMSNAARAEYRNLVYETPRFIEFWRAATPVNEISRLHIGSRPTARRTGGLQVTHIRAIPWVFSWMQSRFNLPGWYGLGTALNSLLPLPSFLRDMYEGWPFFRALLDNAEMSLLKADLGIAALYAELVSDHALAEALFARIRDEYERTREAVLLAIGHNELLDGAPLIQRSIHLRNPYVDPLNYLQVEMLRRLRRLSDPDGPEGEALRDVITITINGIAAGLRNTG